MLLPSWNQKYPPFPLLSYYPVVVCLTSYSVTYCIYVPGNMGICFHYYCAVYDECKYLDTFWLADHTHLFVQYTISLSSLCKLIWRHWACKMSVRYIMSSVWVRLSIFSPLSIIQYMGLYAISLPISLLGLGHETVVSAACLSIFLWYRTYLSLIWDWWEQGKSQGFDSCNQPSNLTQIGFKSSIFQPMWPWNLMDDPEKQWGTSSMLL